MDDKDAAAAVEFPAAAAGSPGTRMSWADLPRPVQAVVELRVGTVVAFQDQPGGFSPGVAARLTLADGAAVFVKSSSTQLNPDTPALHRAEARNAAALPTAAPVPRLWDSFEVDGWVTLVFDAVDGAQPVQPWRMDQLRRVVAALDVLVDVLTPAPVAAPSIAELFAEDFSKWRRVAAGELRLDRPGDGWLRDHVAVLSALESRWPGAAEGSTLLHGDVRADNVLLADDGRVWFVDWPHACIGAAWVDVVLMVPSVAMAGGPSPETTMHMSRHVAAAPADDVDAVVAALAGYFVLQSRRPPPPGIPTVRAFQAEQGEIAVRWIRERLERR